MRATSAPDLHRSFTADGFTVTAPGAMFREPRTFLIPADAVRTDDLARALVTLAGNADDARRRVIERAESVQSVAATLAAKVRDGYDVNSLGEFQSSAALADAACGAYAAAREALTAVASSASLDAYLAAGE